MLRPTAKWFLIVALSPLLILLILILLPVLAVVALWEFFWRWKFRLVNHGRQFLICTTRNGWYDFTRNNVVPVFPSSVTVFWVSRSGYDRVFRKLIFGPPIPLTGQPRPFLVSVKMSRIEVQPIHKLLLPLKHRAKKSLETQAKVAEIIRTAH